MMHTERPPKRSTPPVQPRAHDERDADEKPATSPATPSGRSRSPRSPSRERHQQRHGRGDDRGQRGLDRLHRDEVQPEIQRVLADAEDDGQRHCARFRPPGLAQASARSMTPIRPRDQEAQRQRGERRGVGDDDPRRGEGRRPHEGEGQPHEDRADIHGPAPVSNAAGPPPYAGARQMKRRPPGMGDPFGILRTCNQPLTLSLSALAMVTLTTLSASFLICSPVAGLRTMRSGRSRQ
jgi:hypothetical protein